MLFSTLKYIIVSLLLIGLIHYLYGFFKNTLTVPKVKDLVNKPAQRYNQMFAGIKKEDDYASVQQGALERMAQNNMVSQSMDQQSMSQQSMSQQSMSQQSMSQQSMSQQSMSQESMQAELKNFLNELKKPNTTAIDAMPNATPNATPNAMPNAMPNATPNATPNAFNNPFQAANESSFGSYTPF